MAWTDLKAAVAVVIKTNGNQEITGSLLQSTLNSIIDQVGANATYKGVATPTTVPGTPDGIVFYIASTEGTYSNFAGYVHNGDKLVILTNTAGAWTATELDVLTSVSATARTFAAVVLTNPFTAGKSPRRIGDFAVNTTSGEIWQATATANAAASWNCISAGYYNGRIITNWDTNTLSSDITSYSTATGAPTNTESFYGHHINSNAGTANAVQWAIGYTTNKIYMRTKTASTWGAWSTGITAVELGYLSGVTSNIQAQLIASRDEQIQGGIYDVSYHNDGAVFESLSTLLGSANLSTLIPTSVRHGGMSIRFIQGSVPSSDNKYVQYRLMANTWSTAVANWQGVDNEPIYGSKNLVETGIQCAVTDVQMFGNKRKEKYYIKVGGVEDYSGRSYVSASPFVVLSGEEINVSLINYSQHGPAIAFYDNNKQFISGWNPDDTNYRKRAITVPVSEIPTNAIYARVTFADNGEFTSGYTLLEQEISDIKENISDIQGDITGIQCAVTDVTDVQMFGNKRKEKYYIKVGGVEDYSGRSYVSASPFVVLSGEEINVSLINYSQYGPAIAFYDNNKQFISGWNPDDNPPKGRKQAITCLASAIPSGAVYCRVTFADNGEFTSGYTLIEKRLEQEISDIKEDIDNNNLPDYWLTHLSEKMPTIHANEEDAAMNGDSFFFLTDYHIESNSGYSDDIIKYIQKRCVIKNLVFGGDVFNGSTTKDGALDKLREFYHRFYPITYYGLRGNHEFNLNDGGGQAVKLNDNEIFNYLIRKEVDNIVLGGNDKLYYYRDIDRLKLRYIYLDARYENSTDPIDDTQLSWMESRITELQSDWSVIIFSHQLFALVSPGSPVTTNPGYIASGAKIINKLTSINTGAKIVAIITGHSHYDFSTMEHGFIEVCTTCDTRQEYGGLPTTLGTPNEQAFDVFSINLVAKTLKATRIGRGENRTWTYQ